MTTTTTDHLVKAAEHHEEAAKRFREAALHETQQNDHEADHLVRLGTAHAAHAHQHADEAAKEHATGIDAKCCCS